MIISEIRTYHDFLGLQDEWDSFSEGCPHNVFSTWTWLSTWWKFYGEGGRLLILLAKDNDKIVGIAPLMYSVEKMFGLRMRKIKFIGTPQSDYSDFILSGNSEECIRLFINHLKCFPEKWDCIELNDIPENTGTVAVLGKISNDIKCIHPCPYVALPKSYEAFLQGLSRNKRKNIRRGFKLLENSFEVDVVDCSGTESFEEGMHWLFQFHQKKWESRGLPGVFAVSKVRSFHLAVAKSFAERGWLGLFLLKLSGNPVAAVYGFRYNSKFYSYLSGYDPKYAKYSVANLLRASVMRKCINDGFVEFDFLRGDETYKAQWNAVIRWNRHVTITETGCLARAQYWLSQKYWNRGKELKSLLKIQ